MPMISEGWLPLGAVIIVANLYAMISIGNSAASRTRKMTWIIVVLLVPLAGFAIWLVLGPGRHGLQALRRTRAELSER